MSISTTIITQPSNVSVCKGEGAVFTCVLDTTNTNTTNDNVQWYRFIKNIRTTETVDPDEDNINLLTHTTGNILNTVCVKSFEGENFCGFSGFLLTANILPLKIFLEYRCRPVTTQSMVPPGLKFSTAKVFPTY